MPQPINTPFKLDMPFERGKLYQLKSFTLEDTGVEYLFDPPVTIGPRTRMALYSDGLSTEVRVIQPDGTTSVGVPAPR